MPALRSSTLKQRARAKANMPPLRTHTVRREATKELGSPSPSNNGLGAMSRIPYELRQAIFEQLVPPEITFAATAQSFETDKESSDKNNPQHAAGTPTGLQALLCTSKAIAAEVRRTYQNREYQLHLSPSAIIFEGVRSAIELRCWCTPSRTAERRCNHCMEGLVWRVPVSSQNKPLSQCRALSAFKAIQPMMRRLHVTFTVQPNIKWWRGRADTKRICSASRIWDKVHEAELGGVEVKFTVQVLNNSGDEADLRLLLGFNPASHAYKVNIIQTDLPVKHLQSP
jgi:hypothetical protein